MFSKIHKKIIYILPVLFIALSIQVFFHHENAYADYNVGAGEKCQDNSAPKATKVGPTTVYSCTGDKTTAPAGTQPTEPTKSGVNEKAGAEEDKGTTCAVEKIGWILCPIIEGSAKIADKLFNFLSEYFLEIEPELLTSKPDGGNGTITAWEQARNLANIMFVIAFILIIYSQITGSGLNNYGIKRMLPRLIIAPLSSRAVCFVLN